MTPNKLPPLPDLIRRIRYWSECQDATPLMQHEFGRIADDFEALRQSQSLPAGAVAGLVGKWRNEAAAFESKACDPEVTPGNANWLAGMDEMAARCADELEQALQADAREKGEAIGRCCYGGLKRKSDCASCSAWAATHPAQASEKVGALERIDGMTFMLHEDPDNADDEPVRLVMAMSHNNTVYCHRASQGDNGICRNESATSSQETASE